jgi:hypothetical protein
VPTYNTFLHEPGDPAVVGRPGSLISTGAFLGVNIDVPPAISAAITASGQAVPPSATGVALVDTGATLTCVHEPLLKELGLNPSGTVMGGTAAGQVQQALYMVRLTFPLLGWTVDLQVVGVNLSGQSTNTEPPQPLAALLGRNLLQQCLLVWNGPGGFWTLST